MDQLQQADLRTETFSNSRGWTTVRVTHTPSSIWVERSRSAEVHSAVQAQKECIDEISRLLAGDGATAEVGSEVEAGHRDPPRGRGVARWEFDALVQRVSALERRAETEG
jgi:hypothetical protein